MRADGNAPARPPAPQAPPPQVAAGDASPAPQATANVAPAKGGKVIPHRASTGQRLAAFLITAVVKLFYATVRMRIHDASGAFEPADADRPVIFAIWHNRLALSLMLYHRLLRARFPHRKMAALVSASRDGGLLARVLERFEVQPVRGSSSRRGAQALVEMRSWAARGYDLAVTPDGPRGPKYRVHDGVIIAAKTSGLRIVPVSYRAQWKIRLKSWDRFQIPLPFSRIDLYTGPALTIPADSTDEERETLREELRSRLLAITED